ncbi:MAG: HEPN domain-containing protein [Bacteroidales bacterium]|nr:HEPN domain-containing protein [Bacteroidales bacterium]
MDLDKVKYWTELSDYDLDTAIAMFNTGRWLYVGYMCHQVIEKIFKAYWSSRKEESAPYSHNLINLAQSCGLGLLLDDDQKEFVGELMPLNIEARYPSYKKSVSDALNESKCKELINKTKELQRWVKMKL